jgi:hypothetical protein
MLYLHVEHRIYIYIGFTHRHCVHSEQNAVTWIKVEVLLRNTISSTVEAIANTLQKVPSHALYEAAATSSSATYSVKIKIVYCVAWAQHENSPAPPSPLALAQVVAVRASGLSHTQGKTNDRTSSDEAPLDTEPCSLPLPRSTRRRSMC